MNSIDREMKQIDKMMSFFDKELQGLPIVMQLEVMQEYMAFAERLKPIYTHALILRGK